MTTDETPLNQPLNPIDTIRPDAPSLADFGPYPVGVRHQQTVNPGQFDLLNAHETATPLYDRPLKFELWYPAATGTKPGIIYDTLIRDGATTAKLSGRACRDALPATPPTTGQAFPLVILSHGYPGNRFLLCHLGENLASKGYVVAAIDHTDSSYAETAQTGLASFGSTLVNRPLDQRHVIDVLCSPAHPLAGIIDDQNVGVVGYSMGAYGALVFGGAGVSKAGVEFADGAPYGLLDCHRAGSASHSALIDPRIKAIVPIGPWGMQKGFWDAAGLGGLKKPTLIIAGSADDTSGYAGGIRQIFAKTSNTARHLLTFENAGHNAAAPIPAPIESWAKSDALDFIPFDHYADAVWDSVRMNNIAQHFITAFFNLHLKSDTGMRPFLGLDDTGAPVPEFDFPGFDAGPATGLKLEFLAKGNTGQ
jgi:predicted dienelactone hydrolase